MSKETLFDTGWITESRITVKPIEFGQKQSFGKEEIPWI